MNTQSFITIVCVFLGINAVKLMTGIGVIEILSYLSLVEMEIIPKPNENCYLVALFSL